MSCALEKSFCVFYSHSKLFSNFVRLRCSELTHKFPPRPSEWTPWSWTRWGGWSLLPTTTRACPWTTSQRTTSPWTAPPWTTLVPLHGFSTWGILSWTHPNWSVAIWRWNKKVQNIQKQSPILKLKPGNRIQVITCKLQYLPQKPLWLPFLSLRLNVFLQVFLICLYSLVCLMGLFTNLSLIWVSNNCST